MRTVDVVSSREVCMFRIKGYSVIFDEIWYEGV